MTRVTGPKNGNAIHAKFGVKEEKASELQDCTCLILVSIKSNKFCSGKWFRAIAQDSVRQFKKVTFLIVDELQRFNCELEMKDQLNFNEEVINEMLLNLKNEWWQENESAFIALFIEKPSAYHYLQNTLATRSVAEKIIELNQLASELDLNFNIIDWSNWLASCPSYLAEKNVIKSKYESENSLANSIKESAEEFALRKSKDNENLYSRAFKIAKEFLLEESPGFMIVGARLGYDYVAYTGEMIKAFELTQQYFIKKDFPNKMQWININFVRCHKLNTKLNHEHV